MYLEWYKPYILARGTAGVDSVSTGGTFDISNADRLGKSETQLVNIFIEGKIITYAWLYSNILKVLLK